MKTAPQLQTDQHHRRPVSQIDRAPMNTSDVLFVDNRHETNAQGKLAAAIQNSPQMVAQRTAIEAIHNSPYMVRQRQQVDRLLGPGAQRETEIKDGQVAQLFKEAPAVGQRKQEDEEDELPTVQPRSKTNSRTVAISRGLSRSPLDTPVQREVQVAQPNRNGLPDNLKSGIENLSGMSMDHVKVHYNSSQPAQLNALAYAQGTDIHVGSGQEHHLPHEAWHVVQQSQGRVKPTMQAMGVAINDDARLEHEADVMGERAKAGG